MSETLKLVPTGIEEDKETTLEGCRQRIFLLEQDRERIKRDLHDGILQTLYSVGLTMTAAKLLMTSAQPEAAGQVDSASAQLDQAIREIRQFLDMDLGASEEEEEPLERQMRALVENITRAVPATCHIEIDPHAIDLIPKEHRRQILYILRESVSNCVRHAQTDAIIVSLAEAGGEVTLVVEDDGMGFNYEGAVRRRHGLKNLTARANQIGGRLCITSIPGQGTRLMLKLGERCDACQAQRK
ncbi:MAG TPA: histidine kinase [Nitrospiraceae bacterium]|nr:histidine kinase [Nitrospiraceae bacterium]